jgi:hypothetical protein
MDLMASGSEIEAGDGRAKLLILEMKQAGERYFKIISFLMTYTVMSLVFGVFLFWWQGIQAETCDRWRRYGKNMTMIEQIHGLAVSKIYYPVFFPVSKRVLMLFIKADERTFTPHSQVTTKI